MIEDRIAKLFTDKGLGSVQPPILPVSGGFLHRMYRVNTENGSFAVKHLNPNIMNRPEAISNFKRADALEKVLEDSGVPVVSAITLDGSKLQEQDGKYYYVYPWQEGQTTDWHNISTDQCRIAGNIQGKIHAVAPLQISKPVPAFSNIDWHELVEEAAGQSPEVGMLLKENLALLIYAENEMNRARAALPGIECIVDEDMDPKNVMWDDGIPKVIDLECLERGNPVSSVLQLSLQWAGVTIRDLDFARLKAFFDGYLEAYDNEFRDYDAVFGVAYTWIEWLAYNVERAIGQYVDESERKMGAAEARLTMERLLYLYRMEDHIKRHLKRWFK